MSTSIMGLLKKIQEKIDGKRERQPDSNPTISEEMWNGNETKQTTIDNQKNDENKARFSLKDNVGSWVAAATTLLTAVVSFFKLCIYLYWKGYFKSLSIDSKMISINCSGSINTTIFIVLVGLLFFLMLVVFSEEAKKARTKIINRIEAGIGIFKSRIRVWMLYWVVWFIIAISLDAFLMLALSTVIEWRITYEEPFIIATFIFVLEFIFTLEVVVLSSNDMENGKKVLLLAREKREQKKVDRIEEDLGKIESVKNDESKAGIICKIHILVLNIDRSLLQKQKDSSEKKIEKYKRIIESEEWRNDKSAKKEKRYYRRKEKLEDERRVLSADVKNYRKIRKIERRIDYYIEKIAEENEKKKELAMDTDKQSLSFKLIVVAAALSILILVSWQVYGYGVSAAKGKQYIKVVDNENYVISYSNTDKCLLQAYDISENGEIVIDVSKQKVVELKDIEYSVRKAESIIILDQIE